MSTRKTYIIGFVLSILLTVAAFVPVAVHVSSKHESISHEFLIPYVLVLAAVQLAVQVVLFLHVGSEPKPHWNLTVFLTTLSMVLIVIVASLWIMAHLNYNMTPQQVNDYILKSENFLEPSSNSGQGTKAPAGQAAGSQSASQSATTSTAPTDFITMPLPPLHTIGQITRHAVKFVNQVVRVHGYLLKRESGYLIFSDENGGAIGRYDLPVSGSGIENVLPDHSYELLGVFLDRGLVSSNGNPDHLQLSAPPKLIK